jgi:hypothetical protein
LEILHIQADASNRIKRRRTVAKKKAIPRGNKQAAETRKKSLPPFAAPSRIQTALNGVIPAEIMKKTIAYFYLLSFCPPENLGLFIRRTAPLRGRLAAGAGMDPGAYFSRSAPEVSRRIVAFHQAARDPDAGIAASLADVLGSADQSPECLAAFQKKIAEIAALPARAGVPNRLLQDKGCRRCASPCRFGFFILMSSPHFDRLQELMAEESAKPVPGQSPLSPALGFAVSHLLDFTGEPEGFMRIEDLANLSYCLLVWGMARSRRALPENYLRLYQAANQEFIRRSRTA